METARATTHRIVALPYKVAARGSDIPRRYTVVRLTISDWPVPLESSRIDGLLRGRPRRSTAKGGWAHPLKWNLGTIDTYATARRMDHWIDSSPNR